ncbi:phosphate-starvation-inducible PsiE family protein [Hydrogenothermus marinus]|uniref:Uncharacterized membrane protein (DUF373 family) n=1 Tax=Hydrogenothermus marinus TaxID=133270 RepID=A0A3M0BRT3_9AQUI|nr:phosphate-starvation-inducible PsiE family protein [Hydrogenothermus marinus]RMA97548.1 uncharacterized membrane protein (DUF373 family) [Hydrogenothermus marinus]
MKKRWSNLVSPHKVHQTLGNTLEFFEDLIILALTLVIFYVSIVAIFDIISLIMYKEAKFMDIIPKFLYLFILTELFRLLIIYLKERIVDTSLIVKTTLIAVLREIIIKAPYFKFQDYIGASILILVLGLLYYVPKYVFKKEFYIKRSKQVKSVKKVDEFDKSTNF